MRDKIQAEALAAWKGANSWGTVILPTSLGKTYVGVMAYKSFENPPKTLVITSRIPIVHQWKETFEDKFGISFPIDYLCIQSAYKVDAEYDLVIIDEVHRSLSPEYRKVFQNIKTKNLICLTATLPEEKEYRDYLDTVCPVVYSKTLVEVIENKVIPEFTIYNLEVPLSPKAGGRYKIFDSQFNEGNIILNKMLNSNELYKYKYSNVFDLARNNVNSEDKALAQACKKYWGGMQMRKNVVYSNPAKLIATRQIIDYIGPERKWLLFTKSIKFAEELQGVVGGGIYHSKMKAQERTDVLSRFKENEFNILIAVDALNEGVDIVDADAAICLSGVSTELTNTQQQGRIIRPKEGKKRPIFINLYSRNTVEKGWVDKKTIGTGLGKYVKWITNVRQIQTG